MTGFKRTLFSTAVLVAASSASAATVNVVGTASGEDGVAGEPPSQVITNYNLVAGGNVLVVGAYADAGNAGSAIDFSFGGVAASGKISNGRGAMAYFQTDGSDTSIEITVDSAAAFLGTVVWEIENVDLSLGVDSAAGGDSITTSLDNMLVLGTGFVNGFGAISPTGSVYTSTDIEPFLIQNSNSSGRIGGASGIAATAGSADIAWTGDGDGSVLAYAFAPVPEPSSLALLGLGGLLIARRRRN